jgi:hypothetical protein
VGRPAEGSHRQHRGGRRRHGDPQTILKSEGLDPFEVIDRIAEFQNYAKEKGVSLSFAAPKTPPEDPADGGDGGGDGGDSEKPAEKTRGGEAK